MEFPQSQVFNPNLSGETMTQLRHKQESEDSSRPFRGMEDIQQARDRYIAELQKAQRGVANSIFRTGQPGHTQLPIGVQKGNIGSAIGTMGTPQGVLSELDKMAADKVAAQRFLHPSTDIFAYRRRIEAPHTFRHSPAFGF